MIYMVCDDCGHIGTRGYGSLHDATDHVCKGGYAPSPGAVRPMTLEEGFKLEMRLRAERARR